MVMGTLAFADARELGLFRSGLPRVCVQRQKVGIVEMRVGTVAVLDARELDLFGSGLPGVVAQRHKIRIVEMMMRIDVLELLGIGAYRNPSTAG